MRWDIFCRVIDNHGDAGVCWRLAAELAARGELVRLWIDEPAALAWMAPQGHQGVQLRRWTGNLALDAVEVQGAEKADRADLAQDPVGETTAGSKLGDPDVVVEAFGCDPPAEWVAAWAGRRKISGRRLAWLNLEYLSAEPYVERCHGLPSPVQAGAAAGLSKRFFYPGFTPRTGGLIREHDLEQRQATFDRHAWLQAQGIDWRGERLLSLFCYEPAALASLLAQLAAGPPARLLVTAGRASQALNTALAQTLPTTGNLTVHWLPLMPQREFDHLLWACDLNCVRGEDSLTRALWAGRPLLWQAYPQDDGAHRLKLLAFLDWLQAPVALREAHLAWNGFETKLPPLTPADWQPHSEVVRARLLGQPELVGQLIDMAGLELD